MKLKKILIIVGIVVVVIAVVGFTVSQSQKNVVAVQTGKVARKDIASTVTASGEIRPKTFANISANALGRITKLNVQEGDHVKRGQVLATLESIQQGADVAATRAALQSSETDAVADEASLKTAMAVLNSSKADLDRAKLDWDRAQGLFKDQLIAKSDYDAKKSTYEVASATVEQNQARVSQAKAQLDSARGHTATARAQLARVSDILNKTSYPAPFDGVVTSVPVREGETVVPGIQNQPGSVLMTISDLSVITAEVRVDETDIVNVRRDQDAEITIDALPSKTFKGTVTQIGDNAIIRSSGLSTAQSTASTQEAKDFKVIITLKDPPSNLRPGLSATAKITTGSGHNVLTIPIQALTMRDKDDLDPKDTSKKVKAAAPAPATGPKKEKEQVQGVFVVGANKKAEFRKVETGLTGTTDIEIKTGLNDNEDIITGTYKVLRTIKNGTGVKVDNSIVNKES